MDGRRRKLQHGGDERKEKTKQGDTGDTEKIQDEGRNREVRDRDERAMKQNKKDKYVYEGRI